MSLRRSNRIVSIPAVDYSRKNAYSVETKIEPEVTKTKRTKTVTKVEVGKKAADVATKEILQEVDSIVDGKNGVKVSTTVTAAVLSREYDFTTAISHLKKVDPKLAKLMNVVPTTKFRKRLLENVSTNAFRDLAVHIIYQQIHGKAAESIGKRFIKLFDCPEDMVDLPTAIAWFPTPEMVIAKPIPELRSAGLSQRKAEYIVDLATHFVDKRIVPSKFDEMTDEEISQCLCSVRGIGQWTVDMYLMFHLGHPDVLPLGDLGVKKGIAVHFGMIKGKQATAKGNNKNLPTADDMVRLTDHWRPYRSLGSWYMWQLLGTIEA